MVGLGLPVGGLGLPVEGSKVAPGGCRISCGGSGFAVGVHQKFSPQIWPCLWKSSELAMFPFSKQMEKWPATFGHTIISAFLLHSVISIGLPMGLPLGFPFAFIGVELDSIEFKLERIGLGCLQLGALSNEVRIS